MVDISNYKIASNKNRIIYFSTTHLKEFSGKTIHNISIQYPENFNPWHINVIAAEPEFYLLLTGYSGKPKDTNYQNSTF